jgi:hypothetical protein
MVDDDVDDDDEIAQIHFSCPPSTSDIENTFRMAQVLYKRKEYSQAVAKFMLVCDSLERVIAVNPGAQVEIHYGVFSIGGIADIYHDLSDFNKSIAIRRVQNDFLEFLQTQQDVTMDSNDDSTPTDFVALAAASSRYRQFFKQLHLANDLPSNPPEETAAELRRRLIEARERDEAERLSRVLALLNDASESGELSMRESFWKRNLERITDHPVYFVVVILLFSIGVIFLTIFVPRKKAIISRRTFDEGLGDLNEFMKDHGQETGSTTKTAKSHKPGQHHTRGAKHDKEPVYDL